MIIQDTTIKLHLHAATAHLPSSQVVRLHDNTLIVNEQLQLFKEPDEDSTR